MNTRQSNISKAVMDRIVSGAVTMRPRWQLALVAALSAISLVATAVATIFVANLVTFKLRLIATDRPMYNIRSGLNYYASNFPWLAFIIGLVSLMLLLWLIRKYDFSYHLGRWLFAAVVLASLVIGITLAFTTLNNRLENVGPLRGMYGQHVQQQKKGDNQSTQQSGNGSKQHHGQQH